MTAHLFVGGSRHGQPGQGYSTETMRLELPHTGMPPYLQETYVRTDVRVDIGSIDGPAVVYAVTGLSVVSDAAKGPATLEATVRQYADQIMAADGDRLREHFRFMRTGEGRPWGRA